MQEAIWGTVNQAAAGTTAAALQCGSDCWCLAARPGTDQPRGFPRASPSNVPNIQPSLVLKPLRRAGRGTGLYQVAPRAGGLRRPLETGGLMADFKTYDFKVYKTHLLSARPCSDFPISSRYGSSCQVCFAKGISENQTPFADLFPRLNYPSSLVPWIY